jgi:D-xylose transport system permease protein
VSTAPERTTDPTAAAGPLDAAAATGGKGPSGWVSAGVRRLRGGELGSLPVVLGLAVIWIIFQSLNDRFLTPQNLSNLTLQIASTGLISVGVVLVLLLGEIDLSVGSVSGVTGAVLAVLAIRHGVPDVPGILAAVAVGAAIGAVHGLIFAKLGVPSFVVTLAGLIGWQGLQLYLLKPEGTMNFPFDGQVAWLTQTSFVPAMSWGIGAVVVAVHLVLARLEAARRRRSRLPYRRASEIWLRTGLLAAAVFATVAVLNAWRGVPLALVIFVAVVVLFDFLLRRTRYGRSVYAVGGNVEAARRAGIDVDRIRVSVFAIASMLAAVGGVLAASRAFSVNQQSGGGDVLLNAIAAAVIGGTSLFGGRGSTYSALLGMLVIGSITSGLFLLQLDSSLRFMVTAAVLLAAVILDSLARRSRRASGRA